MKLTPIEMQQIWTLLSDITDVNEQRSPAYEAYRKRIMAAMLPELKFYQELSAEEQAVLAGEAVEIPITKIPADTLPAIIPDPDHPVLARIVEGKIPKMKSKLEEILKAKKKEKTEPVAEEA